MSGGIVPRVRFEGAELEVLPEGRCQVRIDMEWRDQKFTEAAAGETSGLGPMQCAAAATCAALQRVVSDLATFKMLDLERVKVLDSEAVVVALAVRHESELRYSVGFCMITEDEGPNAAVKAVLNGTNRILSKLLQE